MKKLFTFLIMIIFSISLCSCSVFQERTHFTFKNGDTTFTIDTENGTISDGTYLYQYTFSETASGYRTEITYPDGSTYWWNADETGGYGGWSDDYDESRYINGYFLHEILEKNLTEKIASKNIFFIVLLFIIGIFNVAFPRKAWNLEYGWRFKNTEPSDTALGFQRFIGIASLVMAGVLIIM